MKIYRIYIFILIFSVSGYAQSDTLCALQRNNTRWIAEFQKEAHISKQISLIKQKLAEDKIYINPQRDKLLTNVFNQYNDTLGNNCGCKILFPLLAWKTKEVLLELNDHHDEELLKLLDTKTIERIYPILNSGVTSIFSRARCGAILIYVKDRKLKKLIKKL